jgi:hypothetical protein
VVRMKDRVGVDYYDGVLLLAASCCGAAC